MTEYLYPAADTPRDRTPPRRPVASQTRLAAQLPIRLRPPTRAGQALRSLTAAPPHSALLWPPPHRQSALARSAGTDGSWSWRPVMRRLIDVGE